MPEEIDLKLEAIVIPVADVDRSKAFYSQLGWRLDADFAFDNGFRIVQFTPPGSPASIQFGTRITEQHPGTAEGIYLVVNDAHQAHDRLAALGAEVEDVFHPTAPGAQFGHVDGREAGAGERASYGTFASFRDPDGNTFLLQEVTKRLPGRIDAHETTYASQADLEAALVRAATAHGAHETADLGGVRDEKWPEWYAAYMVAEQHGTDLP